MPPNPKRRQSRRGEPPFEEGDILRADDPRPQRVTQYPSATVGRRRKNEEAIPTSVYDTEAHDEELKASYDQKSLDAGGKPAFLYVEKGPGAGQLVPVRQGVLVIGRASVSDLRLQHPSISRRHSQLTRRGERFFFKDLGSQNGTFVNKVKIDREVELSPGDSIGMGAALLKLRGPLSRSEAATEGMRLKQQKAMPTAVVQRPRSSGVVKAMMFAGAVGFGLAAVLAFAVFRPSSSAKTEKASKTTKVIAIAPEVAQPKAARRFQAEPATDEIEIAAGPVNITREKRIDDAIERKMAEQKAKEPPPRPTETVKVAEPVAEAKPAGAEPKKATAAVVAKAEKEEPAPRAQPASKRALLASYEKGDAEGSLDAAKEAGDKALVAQLQKFIAAYDAGEAAYDKNDAKTAISKYEEALAADQKLGDGFGKYGKEIRGKLSNIWLLAGQQFIKASQTDGARNALKESLKYDPSNSKAKSALASLDKEAKSEDAAEEEEKPVARKAAKKSTSSAADDAFGEDEEEAKPKKKAAPAKKASTRSAIDDAFGD